MNSSKASISTSGWFITTAATGLTVLLHYADVVNLPVVAAYLDWIAERIYHAAPMLRKLPAGSSMWIGAVLVGAFAFIVASLVVAIAKPSSAIGGMEAQLRRRQRSPKRVRIQ